MTCARCGCEFQGFGCPNCGRSRGGSLAELLAGTLRGTGRAFEVLGQVRESYRALVEPEPEWAEDDGYAQSPEDFWRPGTIDPRRLREQSMNAAFDGMIQRANRMISAHAERLETIKSELWEATRNSQNRR